ncbi:ABC transporter substrate-binding protein [Streptomyces sp. NPDC001978]|uniref:ABC transporter substrate-binding protein n=1 Tax=Streptomyces sp. NPDC001978 TaxID=3364627 RepID=UPI0036A89D56
MTKTRNCHVLAAELQRRLPAPLTGDIRHNIVASQRLGSTLPREAFSEPVSEWRVVLMSTNKRKFAAVLCIAAIAATVSACSSSGGKSGGASTSDGTTKSPILIGGAGPVASQVLSQPEREASLKASIDEINAAGGINGHPLKYKFCDTKSDANQELACMRQLVADKVSAIIAPGIIVDQSGRGLKAASDAGVPVIGSQGLSPIEFNTKGIFPLTGGIPSWAYGATAALLDSGAKKIGLFGSNENGASFSLGLATQALTAAGVTPVSKVQVDPTADPTFVSGAAKLISSGADGVLVFSSPAYIAKEITALRQAGFKGKISTITGTVTPQILNALGSTANGLLLTSAMALTSDTSNSEVAGYLAAMKKYSPSSQINDTSETTYAAVQLLAQVMAKSTSFTAADVLKAFTSLSTPVDTGLTGPFSVTSHQSYLAGFPNIYNPEVENGSVKNGVIVTDGKGFVNPFAELAKLKSS